MSWRATLMALGLLACGPEPEADAGVDAGGATLSVLIEAPTRAFVNEELCARARVEGGPAELDWNLGDGTSARGTEVCHTYAVVGARTIGVTARADGRTADDVASLTVVFRPADPRPTASSPIVYDTERDTVWVVEPDAGAVAAIDARGLTRTLERAVCERPRTLAVGASAIAVACQGRGSVVLLDADTGEPRGELSLGPGSEPYGVLADPRGDGFFVATRPGALVSFDEAGLERGRVAVGPEARGLAMRADGVVLVTRWRSRVEGASVATVDASDPAAPALVGETQLPPEGDDSDTDNRGVLSFLNQVVMTPDGGRAFVPALKANVVTGEHLSGEPLTSQTSARAAFSELLVRDGMPAQDSLRHSFDDLDYASAVVFTPFGDRAWFAMQGAQSVVLIDTYDFFTVASIGEVGEAPQGLALSPDGERLFVHAFLSRSVLVYDVSDLSDEPARLAEIPIVDTEPLAPEVLEGKRIFFRSADPRMSRTGYLSCASCHLDGEGDGLVWDFTQRGEGLRNTIELRGRAGRAPLHWSANFDEVQDFEHDIRAGQGGTGFLDDAVFDAGGGPLDVPKAGRSAELDALAAYVASLGTHGASPARVQPDFDTAAARGRVVFETAGCDACHAGPDYADSALVAGVPVLHDVGTLGPGSGNRLGEALVGLDTPTLRGLYRTAPYLHDGSAATLEEVLTTRNPADQHGVTSGLSAAELAELVTFLLSLDDGAP